MVKDITKFFGEVRVELRRVEWPSFEEFKGATIVVLFLLLIFSVYLGTVDRMLLALERAFLAFTI